MIFDKLRGYGKVLMRARSRKASDALRLLAKRPAIMAGVGAYETALLASSRVEARLKTLARSRPPRSSVAPSDWI